MSVADYSDDRDDNPRGSMKIEERAIVFSCDLDQLVAIISIPHRPLPRGVLIVVGGPQYRAGSHRQFTLMCRTLAEQGIPGMRFDVRGMGDSEGSPRSFEDIASDIRAAIDRFFIELPALHEVVIWGLCDAASAALTYAYRDPRVTGLVLLNPWVRTLEGLAVVQLKHYYWSRVTSSAFWQKLLKGEFHFSAGIRAFVNTLLIAVGKRSTRKRRDKSQSAPNYSDSEMGTTLPERMVDGLRRFKGNVLFILSGRDLTAQEFEDVAKGSDLWKRLLADKRVQHRKLAEANHTFSRKEWRKQVEKWTVDWVQSLDSRPRIGQGRRLT